MENQKLKDELNRQKEKLAKSEDKLEKKRKFIKEMNYLQNDISEIKASMKQEMSRETLNRSPEQDNHVKEIMEEN
jgi:basic membrane lipoprotein Med (substrate-binding protein (PBP1-ABC) superfamily)